MPSPYYENDGFAMYSGDCLKILPQLPPNHFDMVFADPPYHLSNGGFTVQSGKRVAVNKGKWDASRGTKRDFKFYVSWIRACKRVLKPNGTIWISGTYHSIYPAGFALLLAGYKVLNEIVWYKKNAPPNISCRYFTASHETLIWARKDPKAKHTFNYSDLRNGNWHTDDFLKNPGKQMRSVWSVGTPRAQEKQFGRHPTQKPLALLDRIVLASTRPKDLILDPFSGSSTTGIAAYNNGRRFVGIESDKQYLKLSVRRFEATIRPAALQLNRASQYAA